MVRSAGKEARAPDDALAQPAPKRGGRKKRGAPSGQPLDEEGTRKKRRRGPGGAQGSGDEGLEDLGVPLDAVVKVFCVHSTPNYSLPWQRRKQFRSSGSGFCIDIERKVILTNAHCVEWHAQVKVQRRGSDTKYLAKVVACGWECDLAVLTVEEEEFWESIEKVQLSKKVPHLEEPVLCVGFPVGGDTISVTSGVVSRVEVTTYAQAGAELLGVQIDAAINSGNSGGPAFNGAGQCLGVAFQSMGAHEAENIGYVIPTVVVTHFLNDLLRNNGQYTGFPSLGIETQTMENVHLREAVGMAPKQKGILVSRIAPTSAAAAVLKENDVLLSFDKETIANDGTTIFRKHERVAFSWLVCQKFYGEAADLEVLRDGKVEQLRIEKFHPAEPLVPVHLFKESEPHQGPSYFIVAGLVFTPLSMPFLRSEFGDEWDAEAPVEFVYKVSNERAAFKGEQLVVLTQLLAHDLTVGYETLENMLLLKVNGTSVRNLRHVMELVDACEGENLRFDLHNNLVLILKKEAAKKATAEVLVQHGIPASMSSDLSGDVSQHTAAAAALSTTVEEPEDELVS